MKKRLGGVALVVLVGCAHASSRPVSGLEPRPAPAEASPALEVVRRHGAAFNRHDVEAMAALVSTEVKVFYVTDDKTALDVSSRDQLVTSMRQYFAGLPSAHSEIEEAFVLGPYVTIRERAMWEGKNGPRSQRSIAVYEVRENLVRRAWYFPAVR